MSGYFHNPHEFRSRGQFFAHPRWLQGLLQPSCSIAQGQAAFVAYLKECDDRPPKFRSIVKLERVCKDVYNLREYIWTSGQDLGESGMDPFVVGNSWASDAEGCSCTTPYDNCVLKDTDTYVEAVAKVIAFGPGELIQDGWFRNGKFLKPSDVLHPRRPFV